MKTLVSRLQKQFEQISPLCLLALVVLVAGGTSALAASAQVATPAAPAARIRAEVSSSSMTKLPGTASPLARTSSDVGRLQGATRLEGITLYFSRTDAQKKDLESLIQAQGNKNSPLFHKWLTPEQFGARFGLADADIAKVQAWLQSQGFLVESVARGKSSIRFSGAASQVEAAFATELHQYKLTVAGKAETHFAPATALSVPSALAGVVLGVRNVDDFKPHSMLKLPAGAALNNLRGRKGATAQFTSGQTGSTYLAPGDVTTIYNVNGLTQQGFIGTGQTIAIMGQSAVDLSDVTGFQTAAGLTPKAPTTLLVPGTGSAVFYTGDESESDLDLEWSGAMAPGAQILFVYTGNSANTNGIFDSMQYTVDNNLAQIISVSYGICEFDLGTSNATVLDQINSQAVTQGQSILVASGDSGSTACSNQGSNDTPAQQAQLNVSYPASSPYVTGVGGTTFNEGGDSSKYWASNGSNDVNPSALSYIPEVVWNDDDTSGLASTGGGISTFFAKPSWQTGVAGVVGNTRNVPDIALAASNTNDPYLYCTSDSTAWRTSQGQTSSCTNGFRDSSSDILTFAGGTSFATPVFAGMLALINDAQNYAEGQGLINPTLYSLAAVPATYFADFHDITTGNNKCSSGSSFCSGVIGYSAGTGYDLTTGLGTVDLNGLAVDWPAGNPIIAGTTTTVTASTTAPPVNTNVTFAVAVATAFGAIPTGTVTFTLDGTYGGVGNAPISGTTLSTQTLVNGVAGYTGSFTTAGTHVMLVAYSGDATHAASTGAVSFIVGGTSSGTGSFTMTVPNITASQGSAGSSTITVTPAGGYKGTVQFSLSTSSSALNNACYTVSDAVVTGTTAVTGTLSIDTNANNCSAAGSVTKGQGQKIRSQKIHVAGFGAGFAGGPVTVAAVLFGLLMAGLIGRKSRRLRVLAGVILLATFGFAFTGCGGGGGSSSNSDVPKGTYAVTLIGQDSATASISSSTNFTFTVN